MTQGRQLGIGPTDNTSDQRTPRQRLRLIPTAARQSFVPVVPAHAITRQGEDDMTRLSAHHPRAQGTPIEVSGRVVNQAGLPVRHALLEIWNANTFGRYTHVEDRSDLKLDPLFLGLGRVLTDADGRYRFRTISPGAYLARPDIGRWRPKHIHISLSGGAARLVTQMYFPDDPNNSSDPMAILMGQDFHRNIGQPLSDVPSEVDLAYRFDIVVGGRNGIYFDPH